MTTETAGICVYCDIKSTKSACDSCGKALILKDRFIAKRKLGEGGHSNTYEVTDEHGARFALKVLNIGNVSEWKNVELFVRQFEILRTLEHPGLPKVFEIFESAHNQETTYFLLQELIEGPTLAQRRLDEAEATQLLEHMLQILTYLHTRSPPVLHRDIKPDNIILSKSGQPVLVDFDAARATKATASGTMIGTAGYVPLEQLSGRAAPASDLYALGVTMIRTLTGKDPATEITVRRGKLDFRPLANISERLALVLERMTEPHIEDRPQGAQEVLAQLLSPSQARSRSPLVVPLALATIIVSGAGLFFATRSDTPVPSKVATNAAPVEIQASISAPPKAPSAKAPKPKTEASVWLPRALPPQRSHGTKAPTEFAELKLPSPKLLGRPDFWPGLISAHGSYAIRLDRWTTIGRSDGRTGVFPDIDLWDHPDPKTASRRHAAIGMDGDRFLLTAERDTTNPTQINGRELKRGSTAPIQPGDMLSFGEVELRFVTKRPPRTACKAEWDWLKPRPTGLTLNSVWAFDHTHIVAAGNRSTLHTYDGRLWTAQRLPFDQKINGLWGLDSNDLYAVGPRGLVARFDGQAWNQAQNIPKSHANAHFEAIHGVGTNVWIVGRAGVILLRDGTSWVVQDLPTKPNLNSVWSFDNGEAFAVGDRGALFHRQDGIWRERSAKTRATFYGVWGTAPNDVWAVGDEGTLAHFDGREWAITIDRSVGTLRAIWGGDSDSIFAVGDQGRMLQYDGQAWHGRGSDAPQALNAIAGLGRDRFIAVGMDGRIVWGEGKRLVGESMGPAPSINAIWGLNPKYVWAVGDDGALIRFYGPNAWARSQLSFTSENLRAIWGAGPDRMYAVGDRGTIGHFDGKHWSLVKSSTQRDLRAVTGWSRDRVVAVGAKGAAIFYDGKRWTSRPASQQSDLVAVWMTGPNHPWALNDQGQFLRFDGEHWQSAKSLPQTITKFGKRIGKLALNKAFRIEPPHGLTLWSDLTVPDVQVRSGWSSLSGHEFIIGSHGRVLRRNCRAP